MKTRKEKHNSQKFNNHHTHPGKARIEWNKTRPNIYLNLSFSFKSFIFSSRLLMKMMRFDFPLLLFLKLAVYVRRFRAALLTIICGRYDALTANVEMLGKLFALHSPREKYNQYHHQWEKIFYRVSFTEIFTRIGNKRVYPTLSVLTRCSVLSAGTAVRVLRVRKMN